MKQAQSSSKSKWLTQALILSAMLNAVFVLIFFYFILKDRPVSSSFDYKPITSSLISRFSEPVINAQAIRVFQGMTYEQLLEKLQATKLMEDGYTERDLALACLVKEHFFDIRKALLGKMVQPRELYYQHGLEKKTVIIFAGLMERDYQQIQHFIATEKWPLTSQGLFKRLQVQILEKSEIQDSTLTQAFCQTPEFLAVETLFGRSGVPIKKRILLNLLAEGSWESLAQFVLSQKDSQDFSPARRQCLLLDYISQNSRTAAYLIAMTDRLYAEKRLDDHQVCLILNLLNEKTVEVQLFAKELLAGPRSDVVHQLAAKRLYEYAGEPVPDSIDYKIALAKFCPDDIKRAKQTAAEIAAQKIAQQEMIKSLPKNLVFSTVNQEADKKEISKNVGVGNLRPKFRDKPPASPSPRSHIVQDGESLWMISRKYKVGLEDLMQHNSLQSSIIKPGRVLKIPPVLN